MNASHLRGIIERLLELDARHGVQPHLAVLLGAITADANGSTAKTQNALASARAAAMQALNETFASLSVQAKRDIAELNAEAYFNEALPAEIEGWFRRSQVSPNVGREGLSLYITRRQQFIDSMSATREGFEKFKVESDGLLPGESELKITLPRSLFENELHGLQRELEVLNKIIRVFYEINNTTPEPIEVKALSTTEPVITVAVAIGVALAIGQAVKLCIDILNGAYSLRKAMKEARDTTMVDESLIVQVEAKIHEGIDTKLAAAVKHAMLNYRGDQARENELEAHAKLAFKMLLSRIERGMQIVPRALPPPSDAESEIDKDTRDKVFAELAIITDSLDFPQILGEPMIQLTHVTDNDERQPKM